MTLDHLLPQEESYSVSRLNSNFKVDETSQLIQLTSSFLHPIFLAIIQQIFLGEFHRTFILFHGMRRRREKKCEKEKFV